MPVTAAAAVVAVSSLRKNVARERSHDEAGPEEDQWSIALIAGTRRYGQGNMAFRSTASWCNVLDLVVSHDVRITARRQRML